MSETYGTRNSITVATEAQHEKDLLAGLSKSFDKFSKMPAETRTVEAFDLKETSIGTTQAYFRIGGKDVRLNITALQGVGHTVEKHDGGKFFKIEPTKYVKSISFQQEGGLAMVDDKSYIGPILRTLDFGTPVTVQMDNDFIFNGVVCDINRTDRSQFFRLIEAMGDKLGVTVGKALVNGHVEKKVILRQGKPVTSSELKMLFDQRGIGATVQCAFSVNNLTNKVSLYDIGIPGNRKA